MGLKSSVPEYDVLTQTRLHGAVSANKLYRLQDLWSRLYVPSVYLIHISAAEQFIDRAGF